LKRTFDVVLALSLLLILLPLLLAVALAVKLDGPGPVFFRARRIGAGGRSFAMLKFRKMVDGAAGVPLTTASDLRFTATGKVLAKTKFDELPQLWNVLKGDMGFVGPRPERPEFVDWLSSEIPFYELRHIIRPGLTGWAQVRYGYGATLEETKHKLEYDLYYVKHMSVGLDLLVIFETVKTILLRRGSQ
jgi:lipopolysaccharide/colanic/teichoic acid biosynthesis glycosyltransferase